MKIQLLLIISISLILGCETQNKSLEKRDYKIIFNEGIYVEKFDSTNTSKNRYTANNQTYLEGNKLIYDYYHQDLNGDKFKIQEIEGCLLYTSPSPRDRG